MLPSVPSSLKNCRQSDVNDDVDWFHSCFIFFWNENHSLYKSEKQKNFKWKSFSNCLNTVSLPFQQMFFTIRNNAKPIEQPYQNIVCNWIFYGLMKRFLLNSATIPWGHGISLVFQRPPKFQIHLHDNGANITVHRREFPPTLMISRRRRGRRKDN